jgi:hypothetical protein
MPATEQSSEQHRRQGNEPRHKIKPTLLASLIGAASTVLAALITAFLGNQGVFINVLPSKVIIKSSPTPSASPANTPSVASSQPPPSPATSTSTTSKSPVTGGSVPLVDLTPVADDFSSQDSDPSINGQPQALAICDDVGYDSRSGDIQYDLGRNFSQFSAILGIDDNSAQSTLQATIEVSGDGGHLATRTLSISHNASIKVNVTGDLRMDINFSAPNAGQLTLAPGHQYSASQSPSSDEC